MQLLNVEGDLLLLLYLGSFNESFTTVYIVRILLPTRGKIFLEMVFIHSFKSEDNDWYFIVWYCMVEVPWN